MCPNLCEYTSYYFISSPPDTYHAEHVVWGWAMQRSKLNLGISGLNHHVHIKILSEVVPWKKQIKRVLVWRYPRLRLTRDPSFFFWSTSHQHSGKDAKAQPHPTVAVKGVLGDQLAWKWSLHVFPVVSAGRPSTWHVVYFENPRSAIAYGTHALTFTYQMIFIYIYSIYIS